MKKNNRLMEMLALGLVLGFGVQAQEVRNGGDPNELATFKGANGELLDSWAAVKQDLIRGFDQNRHMSLNLNGSDAEAFKEKALLALRTAKIRFDQAPIQVSGVDRPCENYISNQEMNIHCNIDAYVGVMSHYTAETQYKMVAHEYLSVAGLEANQYGVSDYPYSTQISGNLQSVTLKRWAAEGDKVYPGLQCVIRGDGVPFLRKDRKLIVQVSEYGARMLVSEYTHDNLYFHVRDRMPGMSRKPPKDFAQVIYDLRSNSKNGTYLEVNGRSLSADLMMDTGDGSNRIRIVAYYDPQSLNEVGSNEVMVSQDGSFSRTTPSRKLTCFPIEFSSQSFDVDGNYGFFEELKDQEKADLLKRTVRWLKKGGR